MKVHAQWLRVLHRWLGLVIGLQLVLWTVSGVAMALLPMDRVAGGDVRDPRPVQRIAADRWAEVQAQLGPAPIRSIVLRPLLGRHVYEVTTQSGTRLFDSATGQLVPVDSALARQVAAEAYAGTGTVKSVEPLRELTLAVREHQLPIWRVDFADRDNSSFYVSGTTAALLERRNDSWRLWDVFWMLHNMDYVNRTSFNHPLIIVVGFAAVWLAVTGLWLLLRTGWRSDFKALRRRKLGSPPA